MHSRVTTAEAPARNPIARSLALAVLGVALIAAAIMGGLAFIVLLGIFLVGYLASLANVCWRLFRAQHRVASAAQRAAKGDYIEGELVEVVDSAVDTAPRGPGATA
jgi:hypothetical protein